MDDIEIKERAEEEQNRILAILTDIGISDKRMQMLEPIILNTAWMKAKLDDAREAIKNSQIVIKYDNGGGQKGIRENPLFKGYESLWKSYMQGMNRILDCLPDEVVEIETEVVEKPKTMLELVRDKHRKEA
jgi:hypothetical protein